MAWLLWALDIGNFFAVYTKTGHYSALELQHLISRKHNFTPELYGDLSSVRHCSIDRLMRLMDTLLLASSHQEEARFALIDLCYRLVEVVVIN